MNFEYDAIVTPFEPPNGVGHPCNFRKLELHSVPCVASLG